VSSLVKPTAIYSMPLVKRVSWIVTWNKTTPTKKRNETLGPGQKFGVYID
jgi:hypothetical protein